MAGSVSTIGRGESVRNSALGVIAKVTPSSVARVSSGNVFIQEHQSHATPGRHSSWSLVVERGLHEGTSFRGREVRCASSCKDESKRRAEDGAGVADAAPTAWGASRVGQYTDRPRWARL